MLSRRELEKRIEKKTAEVTELDKRLAESKAYLQALNDMLKLFPVERSGKDGVSDSLREGTEMAKARDAIRAAGRSMHIAELMTAIGAEITPKSKTSLAGSLSGYARKGRIFTRPLPNTFGLIELSEPPFKQLPEKVNFGQDTHKAIA